jgi:hypothetical protein
MAVVKEDAAHPLEGHLFHPGVFYSDHQLEGKVLSRERVRVGCRHPPVSITSAALGSIQATNNPFLFHANITMQTSGSSAAYEASGQLAIDLASSSSAASSLFLDTNTAP